MRVLQPQRGQRADYMRLVRKNAEQNLKTFLVHQEVQETAQATALTELAAALDLPEPPHRIECYDISNIQGTNPVSSMVVFVEGRAKKSEYRRFKIQYDKGPNDFAMMQETLRRRLRYLRHDADEPPLEGAPPTDEHERALRKKERFHQKPSLLLIDGGKGQLNAVVEVLHETDMWGIPVAGLAKEHEWLYVPGQSEPIVCRRDRRACTSSCASATRRTASRSIPSQPPRQSDDEIGARRARRGRAVRQEAAADRVRFGGCAAARERRRDRRSEGHESRSRLADQERAAARNVSCEGNDVVEVVRCARASIHVRRIVGGTLDLGIEGQAALVDRRKPGDGSATAPGS